MDLRSLFTTDEELADLEDRDATTNIVGFIDTITAPHESGQNNDILFKFTVSNNNKRIEVLMWDTILIDKYQKDILSNRVININGAYCRATTKSKVKEEKNMVPFEIIIKENTVISFQGYHTLKNTSNIKLQKVTFDNIHAVEGLIEISGFIRTPFSLIHNRSGNMTYGLGAITDKARKITVQIKQFTASDLEIGDFVTVSGIVKDQDSLVTIYCDSMNNIKLDPDVESLTPEIVQRGGRPVKRIRTVQK
ncbi:hypothetical protein TSAR_009725 [Trichomalopsis sarcophagae]|uniref:OB domain-containing protein n=1 Tax=Trichomalopsis sarcophagae TaxID=543379 RepID=A0A232EUY5_9HYME|nr:hypothetical protein TSAR_009725 [Trichomalopsis sarcophagae]